MSIRNRIATVCTTAFVLFGLSAVPAQADTAEILGTDARNAISDSYIVVFKDTPSGQQATAVDTLATQYNADIDHVYTTALTGFAATMSETDAKRIADHPQVAYVEQNATVQLEGTQNNPPSWGLDRIDQRQLPLNSRYVYPNTASNVRIYILDTGIRTTHSDFGTRATWGTNTVGGSNTDCNGHGTHVAGTAAGTAHGVAKAARLIAVKVLNCNGGGTIASVTAGVDWVTQHAVKPAVANMSLGGGVNTTIDTAVRNSVNSGITYTLAAGNNNGDACSFSPARVSQTSAAITVGNSTNTDTRAGSSNWGGCVNLFAPGTSIRSAWHTSNTATQTLSGTSMAAPHVAGAAALILSTNTGWSPQQVRTKIINDATTNVISNPAGSPNRLLYIPNTTSGPQPPVVNGVHCESGSWRFICDVSYTGTGPFTIRWKYNGTNVPAWNDRSFINSGCSPNSYNNVTVSVSNAGGTSTGQTGFRCREIWQ